MEQVTHPGVTSDQRIAKIALPPKPRRPFTIPIGFYVAAIAALSLALVVVMFDNPLIHQRLESLGGRAGGSGKAIAPAVMDWSRVVRHDPKVGSAIGARWLRELRTASPHSQGRYLLVYIGDCASCVSVDYPAYKRQAIEHGLTMVMLTSADARQAKEFSRSQRLASVPVISDAKGDLQKHLNTAWRPRCYIVSGEGKLEWIQPRPVFQYDPFRDASFVRWLSGVGL